MQISAVLLAASRLSLQSQGADLLFKIICKFPFSKTQLEKNATTLNNTSFTA